MRTNTLSQSLVKEWWFYFNGNLYWNKNSGTKTHKGMLAGSPKSDASGYIRITFKRKQYMLHNLIWIFHHGDIPSDFYVDHIDDDPSNNCIDNLQLLTNQQNLAKRVYVRQPNGSIYQRKNSSKWCAKINYKGKAIHIGTYDDHGKACTALEHWRSINIF